MSASSLRTLYQNVSEAWTDKVNYQIAPPEKIKHTFSSFDRVGFLQQDRHYVILFLSSKRFSLTFDQNWWTPFLNVLLMEKRTFNGLTRSDQMFHRTHPCFQTTRSYSRPDKMFHWKHPRFQYDNRLNFVREHLAKLCMMYILNIPQLLSSWARTFTWQFALCSTRNHNLSKKKGKTTTITLSWH